MLIAIVVVFALLVTLLVHFTKNFRHKLDLSKDLPGPPTTFIVGNTWQFPNTIYELSLYLLRIADEYAAKGENIVRFWVFHLLFVIPINGEGVKEILESNEEIEKGTDYDFFKQWLRGGLLTSNGQKWKTRRRLLTPTFHFSMLEGYVDAMNKHAKTLIDIMDTKTGELADVYPLIKRCALDIICETTMGKDLRSQYEPEQPYAVAIKRMMEIGVKYSMTEYLWIPIIYRLHPISREFDRHLKVEKTFVKNVIQDRIESMKHKTIGTGKRDAFLDRLLKMKEEGDLTMEDIEEEVTTFMFAGHDTTAHALSWTVWALACNPEYQERVHDELLQIFGDSDRECTIDDMKLMVYLDRFIKETMRMYPPVPFITRSIKNDLTMGGHALPGGIDCSIAPLIIHNNKQIYKDPEVFDPDRFLPENVSKRNPFDYIPFSAGPRNCIGQRFAQYEEKVVTSWIVRNFKLSSNQPLVSKKRIAEVILRPDGGVEITIERRK